MLASELKLHPVDVIGTKVSQCVPISGFRERVNHHPLMMIAGAERASSDDDG